MDNLDNPRKLFITYFNLFLPASVFDFIRHIQLFICGCHNHHKETKIYPGKKTDYTYCDRKSYKNQCSFGELPMNNILRDKTPDRLIQAIEENMSSFLPVFGKLGEMHWDKPAGVKRSITSTPVALFNSVMDARIALEKVYATIEVILSDAKERDVPILWWTGPSTRPVDLERYLMKHGFSHDDEAPGMAVDLEKLIENLPTPKGLVIQPAQNDANWEIWSKTMALGFEIPSQFSYYQKAWHNLLRQVDDEPLLPFIGWQNDQPVATCLLFLAAGVAGIYSVTTIPEARRRGMGGWMTLYSLQHARDMGYQIGILQSSEMGLNIDRSLGFKVLCKINMYRWQPE
jgi:GNAT superfamily N-acetyltransferase